MKAIKSSQVPKRENSFNVVIFCAAAVYITVVLIVIVVNKVLIKSDNRVSNILYILFQNEILSHLLNELRNNF